MKRFFFFLLTLFPLVSSGASWLMITNSGDTAKTGYGPWQYRANLKWSTCDDIIPGYPNVSYNSVAGFNGNPHTGLLVGDGDFGQWQTNGSGTIIGKCGTKFVITHPGTTFLIEKFVPDGETWIYDVSGECSLTNYWYSTKVHNSTTVWRAVQVTQGTGGCGMPGTHPEFMSMIPGVNGTTFGFVAPGQDITLTFTYTPSSCECSTSAPTFGVVWVDDPWSFSCTVYGCIIWPDNSFGQVHGPAGNGWASGVVGATTPSPPGSEGGAISNTVPVTYSTNEISGIELSTNGVAADNGTLQQGFSALYDAITKGFSQNDAMQHKIVSTLWDSTNLLGAILSASLGASNQAKLSAQGISNAVVGVSNAVFASMFANTNWLKGQSNLTYAAYMENTNYLGRVIATNALLAGIANGLLTNLTAVVSNASWTNIGALRGGFEGMSNAFFAALSGIGTNLSGGSSNVVDMSGVSNAVVDFHGDTTNLLSQILGKLTNRNEFPTGGFGTNYESAHAIASDAVSEFNSQIDEVMAGVQAPQPGDGGGSPVDIHLGEHTMSATLIPDEFVEVWSFGKKLFGWLLIASFLTKIAVDSYKVVEMMGTAKQLSFPNVNGEFLGFGGNWGVALIPILLTAILVVFGAALGFIGAYLLSQADLWTQFSTDPTTGYASAAVSNGIAFLKQALPLDLIFGLAGGYIIFRLGMTKAMALAVVTVRALLGS